MIYGLSDLYNVVVIMYSTNVAERTCTYACA